MRARFVDWVCPLCIKHAPTVTLCMICSLFFGEDFVAGEVVTGLVVGAYTRGVAQRLERLVSVIIATSVFEEKLHVGGSEVAHKTALLILDFLRGERVFVVLDRRVEEALIESGLQVQLKVSHDACGVTVSILVVNGDQAVVRSVQFFVFELLGREFEHGEGSADASGHPHKRKRAELYIVFNNHPRS